MSTTNPNILSPTAFAQEYGLLPNIAAPPAPVTTVVYTTQLNDRWDLISWYLYGSLNYISDLIANNPQIPINCQLQQGLKLYGPILSAPPTQTPRSPWNP